MINILISTIVIILASFLLVRCLLDFGVSIRLPKTIYCNSFSKNNIENNENCCKPSIGKIFMYALSFRVVMLFVMMMTSIILSDSETSFLQSFTFIERWDANHYINLIEKGYIAYQENGEHLFLVFYPFYVWVVRALTVVIHNTLIAGVIVSSLCYAGACCFIYKIAEYFYNPKIAKDTLVYLSVFPYSFFFGLLYTESLFLLMTSAACYYVIKRKWLMFSIFGICASLTRMTGVLVIAFAFIEICKNDKPFVKPKKHTILKLLISFTPLIGTGIYLLLNYFVDNDPFAFVKHQQHWYQGYMWISNVIEYLIDYFLGGINTSFAWTVQFPTLIMFALFILLLLFSARKSENNTSLLVYTFLFIIATFSLSWLLSAGRYLSCCFALFILIAKFTENKPTARIGFITIQSALLGIYICAYLSDKQLF